MPASHFVLVGARAVALRYLLTDCFLDTASCSLPYWKLCLYFWMRCREELFCRKSLRHPDWRSDFLCQRGQRGALAGSWLALLAF